MPSPVLLVDSNRDERDMYATALALEGIPTDVVASADEALDVIRHEQTRAIVTELRLPGTGGTTLIQRVRNRQPGMFIIALTTSDGSDAREARDAGCDVVLHVPCLPETLVGEIRRALTWS